MLAVSASQPTNPSTTLTYPRLSLATGEKDTIGAPAAIGLDGPFAQTALLLKHLCLTEGTRLNRRHRMVDLGYFQGIARIRCLQLFVSPGSFEEFLISGNQPCNPPTADIRQINSGVKLLLKGSQKALHPLVIRLGYLKFNLSSG